MMRAIKTGRPSVRYELILLGIFMGVGLIHALIYVFIVPPWQHYDEPNHFEVVYLTARLGRHPAPEDYDPQLSREVVQSMVEHGFYAGFASVPDLSPNAQVKILGYPQFEEQPLYYFLASLPLRIYQPEDIGRQLYAARLVSVLLFLSCILSAWGTARVFTPSGHPLRWMLPAFVTLLPGFTDLMTAVNNDVLAVAAFSFFFWGAARTLKYGYTVVNLGWVVLSMALIYLSKNTAYAAFILLPLVLILSAVPKRHRWLAWSIALIIGVGSLVLSLRFDDAAYWHRSTAQLDPIRQKDEQAVHGEYVLVLNSWARTNPPWVPPAYQLLPLEAGRSLKDKEMTLGFWVWSNQPVQVNTPALGTPLMTAFETIQVSQTPSFHALQVKMPQTTNRVWVLLKPNPAKSQDVRLYYDGFVLADGHRPLDEEPQFTTLDGSEGVWGGEPFINYLRNGSLEESWPRVEPRLDNLATRILPDKARPTLILNALLDWPATQVLFRLTYQHLLQTFWARFGWGHVALIWPVIYKILNWVWLIGFTGAMISVLRRWRSAPWDWVWLSLLSATLIWFANLVRGIGYFTSGDLYIPPARYAFPAILPTLTILCVGWLEIFTLVKVTWKRIFVGKAETGTVSAGKRVDLSQILAGTVFLSALIFLAVLSLVSIILYYRNIR